MAFQDALQHFQRLDREAQDRISDDLQRLLDLCWTHRVRHKSRGRKSIKARNLDVYALYNRIFPNLTFGHGHMSAFLDGLTQIAHPVEVQCSIANRAGEGSEDTLGLMLRGFFGARRAASGFAELRAPAFRQLAEFVRENPNSPLLEELGRTFFHYRSHRAPASFRLYLNLHETGRAQVMNWVVGNILALPGCSNAKVGPPGQEVRADVVVMYFADQPTVDDAVRLLREFQRGRHRECFQHGIPRMLQAIEGLRGVGFGAEPPVALQETDDMLVMRARASSFGTYRSQLIEMALEYTLYEDEGKPEFIDRVVEYFRSAGISPAHPERHVNIQRLIARTRQIERLVEARQPIPDEWFIYG